MDEGGFRRRVTEIPKTDDLEEIGVEKKVKEEVPEEEQFPLLLKTIGNLESRIDGLESRFESRMDGLETRMNWWCGVNTAGIAVVIVKLFFFM